MYEECMNPFAREGCQGVPERSERVAKHLIEWHRPTSGGTERTRTFLTTDQKVRGSTPFGRADHKARLPAETYESRGVVGFA